MTDRAMFLARVKARMQRDVPENIPHPIVRVDEIPAVEYVRDLSDPVEAFIERSIALGVTARSVHNRSELEHFLDELLSEHTPRSVVLSADPEAAALRPLLEARAIAIAPQSIDGAAQADIGFAGAAMGIAATGTLVLDSTRANGRTASLLPGVFVALIRAETILSEAGQLLRNMNKHFPDGPPSQMVFVSGPSRSADIELTLTVGVHGPGRVWIAVVHEEDE